jgi:2-iminobutanoate/2-iminopropanoate deaminase
MWYNSFIPSSSFQADGLNVPAHIPTVNKEPLMRDQFQTAHAPSPRGPYSQAIITQGRQLWVSGQIPVDPQTGQLVEGGFEAQAHQVFRNVKAVVENAGGSLASTIKAQVYLHDLRDRAALNAIFAQYFPLPYPARTTIQSNLGEVLIEVDVVVALE